MASGITLLRLVVGGLFVGHGLQKLVGAFDGPGLDGTEGMMKHLEIEPARANAIAVAGTETAGGAAIALGVGTPFAAAGLIATMLTAVRKVHFKNGVWNSKGGFEFNAVLIAALLAIVDGGPGKAGGDALIGKHRWGLPWAAFALAAGVAGSFGVTELAKRATPAPSEPPEASTESADASI